MGSSPSVLAVWINGYCWMHPFPEGEYLRLCGPELWGWRQRDKTRKSMGWVCLTGLSAFGIMIQWKYCVADCCRILLHGCNSWWNYSPWWSVFFFYLFFPLQTALAYLLSPQNIRCVPCLYEHLCALTSVGYIASALPCLLGDSPHSDWDVIATIGLYNSVHKSSLCECTFDKVYLFICKHLIINRQYI